MRHKTGILPDQIVSESPDLDRKCQCSGNSLPMIDEDDNNEDSWDCQTPKSRVPWVRRGTTRPRPKVLTSARLRFHVFTLGSIRDKAQFQAEC
ncbi:uncharacterized protein N7498_009763 [Penicillium cinerascens]|uniref:Uncharacterized protein n=1 Tax=Penicillium cinerascens TaxID=70096 RepID=A0A9W9M6L3_9EURO|nr:uncharacterized protein N7498_009763 [Penicillium cinerascens]KAJ5190778.1 hypothetical protein N7498_009763 [Penicillium cinerascens]